MPAPSSEPTRPGPDTLDALRRQLRRRRAGLARPLRDRAAEALVGPLLDRAAQQGWRRVAAYVAVGSEIDPAPAVVALVGRGIAVALPRVENDHAMSFRIIGPETAFESGAFAIPTPVSDTGPMEPAGIDAVLVPLVGFDDQGRRLGAGGGYYDRALPAMADAERIGLAFDSQRVARLPVRSWDQRLDLVLTATMALSPPRRCRADPWDLSG